MKSRRQLPVGVLSLAFVIPAFVALDRKDLILAFDSMEAMLVKGMLGVPILFGSALIAACLMRRRRPPATVRDAGDAPSERVVMWHYIATGSMGCVAAAAPFLLLLYRAADYQVPDSYVLDDRVRPDVGWCWIGLYAVLVLFTIAVCLRKAARGAVTKGLAWQPVFVTAALCVGARCLLWSRYFMIRSTLFWPPAALIDGMLSA